MKKRLLSVSLALVLAISLLTGCGSGNGQTTTTTAAPTTTTAPDTTTTKEATTEEPTTTTVTEAPTTVAPTEDPAAEDTTEINVGVLKGPTGMGAIKLMDDAETGVFENYHFTLTPEVTDIVARLSNGSLDIGALPTNVASNLYNKTNGGVKIIALNCLGVLYIARNKNSAAVESVEDLRGRTIYCNGQGNNPEYVINYILRQNGLEPGVDVELVFGEASEISAKMIAGEIDLCMLPIPAVTTVLVKNQDVEIALDLTEEYDAAANNGSTLTMGSLVVRTQFLEEHPEAVDNFLKNYAKTVEEVVSDYDMASELIAKYEIVGSAAIAKKALPDAGIVCITGSEIRSRIEAYYQVLFDANPASIGGAMPGDDFYYEGEEN